MRNPAALCAIVLLAASFTPGSARAGTDFGQSKALGPQGPAYEYSPQIATDGNATWVTVWNTTADPGFATEISRSLDDGQTWSHRQKLMDSNSGASIATDGSGKWIVADIRSQSYVVVMTSTDNAATWSAPQDIFASFDGGNTFPRIATDRAGTWIVVWRTESALGNTIGQDGDILFSRSTDGGDTWSSAAPLHSDAATDSRYDTFPHLATDGSGVWVVSSGYGNAEVVRSTDNGATWSAPLSLNPVANARYGSTDVATDGAGNWVTVWTYQDYPDAYFVASSHSTDNGATWSPGTVLHPYFKPFYVGYHAGPNVIAAPNGEWQVVWESSDGLVHSIGVVDSDLLTSYSRDGGVSWSSPAALTTSARRDGLMDDFGATIATSPTGRTIAAWTSAETLTNGDSLFRIAFAGADRECPTVAREDCLRSTEAEGSSLSMKDAFGGADRLSWRLRSVEATSDLDIGTPTTTDDYVLCLYEEVDSSAGLVGEWNARAGVTCGDHPCWTLGGGKAEMRDSNLANGSIRKLTIRSGADGEAYVRVVAGGPAVALPALPLNTDAPVRIQLANLATSACWEGIHDQASTNDPVSFQSRSD